MQELSSAMERERELLDQLRFRFVETRLLLTARETRYLAWATAEVDQARVRAREADLLRAAHLHRIESDSPQFGRLTMRTLREVAAEAPEPWAGILRDHHEGLCAVVSEIEVIGHRNAELARVGIGCLAENSGPSLFDGWLQSVGPVGLALEEIAPATQDSHQLADEQSYQDVIITASRLRMPALLAFLR